MSAEIIERITDYFHSPLKEGEDRKILYLFDEEKTHWDTIVELSQETKLFTVLDVHPASYFKVQHQIERELPLENLFLYYTDSKPMNEENPLLDVLLYSEELKVDREAQLYRTLGITHNEDEFREVIHAYPIFFRAKDRLNRAQRLFQQSIHQNKEALDYSILASLVKAPTADWMAVLIELFEAAAQENSKKWEELVKFGNEDRFWLIIDELLSYNEISSVSGQLSIKELMQQVFVTHLNSELEGELPQPLKKYVLLQANPIVVFVNQWMNTRNKKKAYKLVANEVQDSFNFDKLFEGTSSSLLAKIETFEWFDHALINQIIQTVLDDAFNIERHSHLISIRRNTFWYSEFREVYHYLQWSVRIIHYIEKAKSSLAHFTAAEEMWENYHEQVYRIDQAYRKYVRYGDVLTDRWKETTSDLHIRVERLYTNSFLTEFTEKWDRLYTSDVSINQSKMQRSFFEREVKPFIDSDRRVFVIISDGLRYEAGRELFLDLTQETRFNGEMDWMQTDLPSTTAVGMANLLPHEKVQLRPNGDVLIDGKNSSGVKSRDKILKEYTDENSLAVQATEINRMSRTELRDFVMGTKVVYIYHNRIDAIGDQRTTEDEVFKATEEAIIELKQLMSRLATELTAKQFLVTADHGYLYTRSTIEKSKKVNLEVTDETGLKNKRFLLSEKLIDENNGLSFYLKEQDEETVYVTVPRGMNRFALQGGGYQYVHGGHLPQEMMVPLLRIQSDRGPNELLEVGVSLISQTRNITNSVIWLDFLQLEPVMERRKEKQLKLYFEDENGQVISNEVLLIADSENSASDERVFTEKFVLLDQNYSSNTECYFVMQNNHDQTDIKKEKFKIDLI